MCGLVVSVGAGGVPGQAFVMRGSGQLAHRGPNDDGVFVGDGVALSHRRLSIVDLSAAGHQPMTSPDGRWTLVYNGEIYNHEALRQRLCGGWSFRGRSDSETLLAALSRDGPDALPHLVGMWALALWDARERQLLVTRDRYGQKPLYWRPMPDGSVRFSSEIAPLIEPGEQPEMFAPAIAEFLATGNYGHLGDRTFFEGIRSFPPAHWARVAADHPIVTPHRYWRFPIAPVKDRRPYDAIARRQFRDAFHTAVESQLMSDVPIGATLSGGLDSSAVVGVMASSPRRDAIPIVTAQVPGSPLDESGYVRAVADRWPGRLDVHWVDLGEVRLSRLLQGVVRIQEEPFGDPSIVAHGLLMDAARAAGVPVVLGGQGGDELLFGYVALGQALLAASMRSGRVGWALSEGRAMSLPHTVLLRLGLSAALPKVERWARERSRRARRSWLSPTLREAVRGDSSRLAAASDVGEVWREFVERVSLPHLTHYDDRNAMARSIEGRMPFLDHRIAEVVGSLDEHAFLRGGRLKRVLRDACADLLPQLVLDRRDKQGFHTPLAAMLRADHAYVRSMVTDEYARAMDVYDVGVVEAALTRVARQQPRRNDAHRVWRALAVRVWAGTFGVRSWGSGRAAA